jgi:tRNA(Ile)-lysidine synthase
MVSRRGRVLVLNKAKIASVHPALQRHLFREVLEHMLGSTKDVEWRHIESLRKALFLPPGKMLSLPRGLALYAGYGELLLAHDPMEACPLPPLCGEHRLQVPGETSLPGWIVKAAVVPHPDVVGKDLEAHLDLGLVGKELWVRGRREGDIFQPLGMAQPKKMQDFMVEARIPRSWRSRVPFVCNTEHIVWVVGWRIDDRVKVTQHTGEVLHIIFEPTGCS